MQTQVMRISHYAEEKEDNQRVTINPDHISVISAGEEDVERQGRKLRQVTVINVDGMTLTFFMNHADLDMIEKAVGTFILPPDDMI